MAPLPKKKRSKASQGDHRAHSALRVRTLGTCPQCRSPKAPHVVCNVCGTYNGRQVLTKSSAPAAE